MPRTRIIGSVLLAGLTAVSAAGQICPQAQNFTFAAGTRIVWCPDNGTGYPVGRCQEGAWGDPTIPTMACVERIWVRTGTSPESVVCSADQKSHSCCEDLVDTFPGESRPRLCEPGPGGAPVNLTLQAGGSSGSSGDLSLAPAIELFFSRRHSLEFRLGKDNLEFDRGEGRVDIDHFSVSVRTYVPTEGQVRFFVSAGLGAYDPDPGSTETALSYGLGLQYLLRRGPALEFNVRHHDLDSDRRPLDFTTFHVGVRVGL